MSYIAQKFELGALYMFIQKCYMYKEQPPTPAGQMAKPKAILFDEGTMMVYVGTGDFSYIGGGDKYPTHRFLYNNWYYYIYTSTKVPLITC